MDSSPYDARSNLEDSTQLNNSSKSVKVTYSGRNKRRRGSVAAEGSAEESDFQSSSPDKPTPSKKKRTERKPAPKKVDVFLPPPSPKRSRFAPDDEAEAAPKSASKPISKQHSRTPSIPQIDFAKFKSAPSTPKVNSSPSTALKRPKSSASLNPISPPSISDTEKSAKKTSTPQSVYKRTRTEEERVQFLEEHPDCGDFEPRRAFCTRCDKWVALSGAQQYPLTRWNQHVERHKPDEVSDGSAAEDSDDNVSGTPSTAEKGPRTRTEAERLAYLEADQKVMEIKDHEVQCMQCQRWVKLGLARRYMLLRWDQHKLKCLGTIPSTRVATANRKLQLVNDSQAKSFTSRSVECASCDGYVILQGEGDYDLTTWHEHKSSCKSGFTHPEPTKSNQSSPVAAKASVSVASDTDATVVASETSPVRGQKRPRELEAEDSTRVVRARTENYVPPKGAIAGVWEWVTLPWKTFISGFKQGLGTPTAPNP